MSVTYGGESSSYTLSAGFLSNSTSQTGTGFSGVHKFIYVDYDNTADAGFALFITAGIVAASAMLPGLAAGARGRILQHWLLVVSIVLSMTGVVIGDLLFKLAYKWALEAVAGLSAYFGPTFTGSATMPGRAVAITGLIINCLTVGVLARWQREDAPSHYGGMSYFWICWPAKRNDPVQPLTPVAPAIKTAEELAAERALALWNQPTPLPRRWQPAPQEQLQEQPQAHNPIIVVTSKGVAMHNL